MAGKHQYLVARSGFFDGASIQLIYIYPPIYMAVCVPILCPEKKTKRGESKHWFHAYVADIFTCS